MAQPTAPPKHNETLVADRKAGAARPDQAALAEWWKQIDEWRAKDCLKYNRKSKEVSAIKE